MGEPSSAGDRPRYSAVTVDHLAVARRIMDARDRFGTLEPLTDRHALTLDDAYAIQSEVTAIRLARGARRIGWKLGYTSLVMREQMGVDAPNFGPLTDAMSVASGDDVAGRFTQPRVEPEVALRFARDLPVDADLDDVLGAVVSAHAALEIVDSVWRDYRFTIEDNTADGSSAAGVVIGPEIDVDRVADVDVRLLVDGVERARGVGSDASGHPALGVVWLVGELAARGEAVHAGDVVITGGLTAAVGLGTGVEVSANFDDQAVVRVRNGRTT